MIYTLTLNPAIDLVVQIPHIDLGETNRMDRAYYLPGGKGINVSRLLHNLGMESLALGYIAGFSGREIDRILREEMDITTDFIEVSRGFTRINLKIKAGEETEINGLGPDIGPEEVQALYDRLDRVKSGDFLFLSGSIPASLGKDFYQKIMESLAGRGVEVVVDATGESLTSTLPYRPFLVKPNRRELEELLGHKVVGLDQIKAGSRELQEMGAQNIIISLGGEGAYFLSSDGQDLYLPAPKGKVIDTVGSGDSMVAGFVYASCKDFAPLDAFAFSVACGSQSAFSRGLAQKDDVFALYEKVKGEMKDENY